MNEIKRSKIKIVKILFLLCIIITASFPANALAGLVVKAPNNLSLKAGLIGYWSLDGSHLSQTTAEDQSGNVKHGTLTANGFTSPRIFVNGIQSSTITTAWQEVTVITDTLINASAVDIGRISTNYFSGTLDEIWMYNRALTSDEAKRLYKVGR